MRKLVGLILVFLLLLTACSNGEQPSISKKEYEHIPYVSDLSQEECFVCGENPNHRWKRKAEQRQNLFPAPDQWCIM